MLNKGENMSENQELFNKKEDEVDLVDLFSRLGKSVTKGFRTLGRALLHVFFFMLRNWHWLACSILLGSGISYLMKISSEKFYTSELTLRTNTISNAEMISFINRLHTFCKEENSGELASVLSVTPEKVKYIRDIEAFWVIDLGKDNIPDYVDFHGKHNVTDTLNIRLQDRFVIRVKTTIPQELSVLRDGIISYIQNNQFYVDQNTLRLAQLDDLLERIDYEVQQLDSLQKVKYFEESRRLMPKEGGQMIFLQDYQTQLLHNDIGDLIRQKQDLERTRSIYPGIVTLLNDFTPPFKPDNGMLYYGKIIIPVIFVLAIILILLIRNRNRFTEAYKKY